MSNTVIRTSMDYDAVLMIVSSLRPRRLFAQQMFVGPHSNASLLLVSAAFCFSSKPLVGLLNPDYRNDKDPHSTLAKVESIQNLNPAHAILWYQPSRRAQVSCEKM